MTVADLLERAGQSAPGSPAEEDSLGSDERWYQGNLARLRARYAGRSVAIVEGVVVDDADFSPLASRVFRKLGPRAVFMPRVGADEKVRIRSPRLVKA